MADPGFGEILLQGRHVRLEPLGAEHLQAIVRAARAPEIWQWLSVEIRDIASAQAFIDRAVANRQAGLEYPFAVIGLAQGRVIGSTRYLDVRPEHRTLEVGYTWYEPAVHGTFVNPECKLLLLRHAFEVWNANRVALKTDVRNLHSQAAIRKLGAQYEGTLRHDRIRRDGSIRDTVVFSVTRPEWPQVQAGLAARLG